MPSEADASLSTHYTSGGLLARILIALGDAGIWLEHLTPDALSPVDQFHIRGKAATLELAALGSITRDDRVLDVGGGIGGPARALAGSAGCRVHVLDLLQEFCSTGEALNSLTGLESLVTTEVGDARDLPPSLGEFDVVWTQHSSMNVDDKARMYREFWRVLRPGGRFVMHEICAGAVQPLLLPVPWASNATDSHLQTVADTAALIRRAGFRRLSWRETTEESLTWLRKQGVERSGPPPPLGVHLLLGPGYAKAMANLTRNLTEGRVAAVEGLFEKPGDPS